jgi:ketosteroid isomerase-like protein
MRLKLVFKLSKQQIDYEEIGMHPFRAAVEARDLDAVAALLADDVVFTSPVAFQPYPGKAITAAILRAVIRVFEDFRYVREIGDDRDHAEATAELQRQAVGA